MKGNRLTAFFAIYAAFTIICCGLSLAFSERRLLMFQVWHMATAAVWIILAIIVLAYILRL